MILFVGMITISIVIAWLIRVTKKNKEIQKQEAYKKEMEKRFKYTTSNLSLMSGRQLSDMLMDLMTTEIIYDNLVVKLGKDIANSRCGCEKYGCKDHREKMILMEKIIMEQKKRGLY